MKDARRFVALALLAGCGQTAPDGSGVPDLAVGAADTAVADTAVAAAADLAAADLASVDSDAVGAADLAAPPDLAALPDLAAPPDLASADLAPAPGPRVDALSPPSATQGARGFTLTIRGGNFLPGSTVTWAGAQRMATFVNPSTLTIAVADADLGGAGRSTVVVANPGGGSASAVFAVFAPFTTRAWLKGSIFKTSAGWFPGTVRDHVWLADVDGDRIDDLVGLADNGDAWLSRGTGTGFAASAMVTPNLVFKVSADWFRTDARPRVWIADVTGDGKADLVGVDNGGGVWVSESTGAAFKASRMVAMTGFTTAAGYFAIGDHEHVRVADLDGDGKADILGISPANGRVGVALASGAGTDAKFSADAAFLATSLFTKANEWFLTAHQPRLFLGDVTGDGRADLVGLASNGDLWVSESTGAAMKAPRMIGNTVFADAGGWFATNLSPRVSLADVNGDGKLDVVGFGGTAVGDGDIWALEAIGSGTSADFYQRVLLDDSQFRTADGWFATRTRQRVWLTDVTGDGRADVLAIDDGGGVWVARSASESSSPGVMPARSRDFFLPAVKNGESGLGAAAFLDPATPGRLFIGDVTGDGARDVIAISGHQATDGDVLWRMASPAQVRSITPVTRQLLASGGASRIEVKLSRRIDPAAFDKGALMVAQDQAALAPSAVAAATRGATFDVPFVVPKSAEARVDLALAAHATDAWGHGVDGDGDGLPGGIAGRPRRWSATLVAGASRVSIMPPDPPGATGIPRSSGFGYCKDLAKPGTAGNNPLEARVLVLGGGGACSGNNGCAMGQSCIAGQCQGGGVDANQPLVLVAVDLIGANTSRLAELLEARFGVPKQNLIVNSSHTHAAFRTIQLFNAPYFDDRRAGAPYLPWLEDRIADAVGDAIADLTPVEMAVASGASSLGRNRHTGAALPSEVKAVNAVALRTPGSLRTRAVLVNFAMHPVIMTGASGINADFPGYMRQKLEELRCAKGDAGCAVLFLQAGAGDINPADGTGSDDGAKAQAQGHELAQLVHALALDFKATGGAQLLTQRRAALLGGTSACNVCMAEPRHIEKPAIWTAITDAVAIGPPGAPVLRFGTLPGEAFSGLQSSLVKGFTPAPLLLAYTNGYLGYFPDQASVGANPGAYGVAICTGGNASGPTFFSSTANAPTNGDVMVTGLRDALNALR